MLGLTIQQIAFIFQGAGWTIVLSLFGFVGGTLLGLPLALARSSKRKWLRAVSSVLVQIVQGVPLPIIMFIVYFGISIAGFELPALAAAGIAMTLYAGAYLGEIWKGCIQAVPLTQWEAAECLALTNTQRLVDIILPQALKMAIPPTVGFFVQIVKNTSYAVVINVFELTFSAKVINNSTFMPFTVFTLAALIYFAICFPLSVLAGRMERKLHRK